MSSAQPFADRNNPSFRHGVAVVTGTLVVDLKLGHDFYRPMVCFQDVEPTATVDATTAVRVCATPIVGSGGKFTITVQSIVAGAWINVSSAKNIFFMAIVGSSVGY